MITITINGQQIQTEPSKTIIEAAFENGMYIPHFCWHPSMSVSGNCRVCLVEVENMPKQVIACSTLCSDGMVVHVDSDKAIKARESVMEFILINHPLDCPICDEAGECKLQDYAYNYSVGQSRFDEVKNNKRKRDELGPHVMFDAERCISCSRCIRFCDEVVGEPQLTFRERGDRVTIETFPGKKLDNAYSMNVIDICPVGALTSKEFRFRARVWDMASTDGICTGCARGCNTHIWTKQNKVLRLTPRENQNVNDFWMCDEGRLKSYEHVNADTRIMQPALRREGTLANVTWDEANATVLSELKHYKKGEIAFVASPYDTCEDLYVLNKLATEVFDTSLIGCLEHEVHGSEDELLIRSDKTPNKTGAAFLGIKSGQDSPIRDILNGLQNGTIKALIVTDHNAYEHQPLLDAIKDNVYVVAIVSNTSPLTERADAVLAAATYAEKKGTMVNFESHLQLLNPTLVTTESERRTGGFELSRLDKFGTQFDRWGKLHRPDCRGTWVVAARLAELLGTTWKYRDPEDVFDEISRTVPAYKDLSYDVIGRRGHRLEGDPSPWKVPYAYEDIHP